MPNENASLFDMISILHSLMLEALEPTLKSFGITHTVFDMLAAIASKPRGISQIEVAEMLGISAATLSEALLPQIEQGRILREPHPRDRRAKRLTLLAPGMAILRAGLTDLKRFEADMTRGMSASRVEDTKQTLFETASNFARLLRQQI